MWMLGHKPRSSTRAASALNNGVSLQPTTCTLISTFLRRNFWCRDHHLSVPYCKLGYWDWNRLTNMPRVKPKVAQAGFENKPPWYCSLAYFLPLVTNSALIPGLDMFPLLHTASPQFQIYLGLVKTLVLKPAVSWKTHTSLSELRQLQAGGAACREETGYREEPQLRG